MNNNIIQEFENYLLEKGQRLNTRRGNTSAIKNFLIWLQPQQIECQDLTYIDLLAYISYSKQNQNVTRTINGKLIGIKHFYRFLIQKGIVSDNPAEELRIKGEIKRQPHDLIEFTELEEVYINYPTGNLVGKRNKAIFGMMIYQGLNSGEVSAVELTAIKLEEAKIYIPSVGRSNSRTLKLASNQILALQKYITQVRPVILGITQKQSEKLFISTGTGSSLNNVLAQVMKKVKQLNPKIKTPKQTRASVLTYWLKTQGIRQIQYMAGHRYVSSTERYKTNNLETLQEQIEKLHPLK